MYNEKEKKKVELIKQKTWSIAVSCYHLTKYQKHASHATFFSVAQSPYAPTQTQTTWIWLWNVQVAINSFNVRFKSIYFCQCIIEWPVVYWMIYCKCSVKLQNPNTDYSSYSNTVSYVTDMDQHPEHYMTAALDRPVSTELLVMWVKWVKLVTVFRVDKLVIILKM